MDCTYFVSEEEARYCASNLRPRPTDRPFVKCLLSHARVTNDVIGPAMVVFFGNGNVGCVAVRLILGSYNELKLSPQEIRGSVVLIAVCVFEAVGLIDTTGAGKLVESEVLDSGNGRDSGKKPPCNLFSHSAVVRATSPWGEPCFALADVALVCFVARSDGGGVYCRCVLCGG